jgi:hypothetical protein
MPGAIAIGAGSIPGTAIEVQKIAPQSESGPDKPKI